MFSYPQENLEALYLTEIERQNLLVWSEDFSQWSIGGNTVLDSTTEIGPDGRAIAYKIHPAALGNTYYYQEYVPGFTLQGTYSCGMWAKSIAGSNNLLRIDILDSSWTTLQSTGTTANWPTTWTQIVKTVTMPTNAFRFRVYTFVDPPVGSEVAFTMAQLNKGSTLLPYVPTTGRRIAFDYTGNGNDLGVNAVINPIGKYLWLPGNTTSYISTPNTTSYTAYWEATTLDGTLVTGSTTADPVAIGVNLRNSLVDIKVFSDAARTIMIANLNIARDAIGDVNRLYSKATGEMWTIVNSGTAFPILDENGLLLNGDYATATFSGLSNTGVTIAAHTRFDSTATTAGYSIGLGDGASSSVLAQKIDTTGSVDWYVENSAATVATTNLLSAYANDKDSYMVLRQDGTSATLDINGATVSTLTPPTTPFSYQRLVLGADPTSFGSNLKGTISVAAVYSKKLSDAESVQTYRAAKKLLGYRGITLADEPPITNIKAAAIDLGVALSADFEAWASSVWSAGMSWAVLSQPTTGIELDLQGNGACAAWWGDGSTDSYALNTSSNTAVAHTYASAATRPVVVLGGITRWEGPDSTLTSYGTKVQYLPASLTYLNAWGSSTLSGNISTLPASLTLLSVGGSNTLSGDISTLPASLTILSVAGGNTLSGDISTLPASLTYLGAWGSSTLSGDISTLPASLTYLSVAGGNTLSGDISTLSASLTTLSVQGSSTLSGDIGTLPASLTYLDVAGSSTLSGDISTLPASLTLLSVRGSNTLSGDISTLSASLTYLLVTGSNTLSGDISTAPASLTLLLVWGGNTLSASLGTSAGIPTPVSYVDISNMLTASVDNVLEAMAANVLASKPRSDRIIALGVGTAQPRSTASDAAVTTLTSATPPYTVTTTPPTNLITGSSLSADPVGTVGSSTVSHATGTVTGLGSVNVVTWVQATTADIISVTSNRTFNVTPGEALNISMYINSTLASAARLQAIVTVDTVDYYLQADGVTWSTTAWEWEPDVGTLNQWNRSVTATNIIPAGTTASLHFLSMYRNTANFTFKLAAWQVTEGTTLYPYQSTG